MILETRKKRLSELRTTKDSIEDVLRTELSGYGVANPAFTKQITNGTTTEKSLQDVANSMALARNAVDETEREIPTLRTETDVLSRQIDQVIARMTAASLRVFFSRTRNNILTASAEVGFNLSI